MVGARTTSGFLTYNGSTPSSANGIDVVAGVQPMLVLLGYNGNVNHQLKWASSAAANAVLLVTQQN